MDPLPPDTDPRLWVLREALSAYASDPGDPPPRPDEPLRAAVALIVRAGPELDVLLIRRARSERDPWSGHMALPGGRRDPSDANMARTAVRETEEETGVSLDSDGVLLGRLEEVAPVSRRLPRLTISPFVFGVPAGTAAHVASPEVDAVLWVPLDVLRSPATRGTVEIALPEGRREFPCLRIDGEVVWGLTYRILTDFFELYPEQELRTLA